MSTRANIKAMRERLAMYRHGWDILAVWATCPCADGECPLEREMARLGVTPGGLLLALVTGDPKLMWSK